jgi:hypothetical protein
MRISAETAERLVRCVEWTMNVESLANGSVSCNHCSYYAGGPGMLNVRNPHSADCEGQKLLALLTRSTLDQIADEAAEPG